MRIRELKGLGVVHFELIDIGHDSARTVENAEGTSLRLVIEDRGVSSLHHLITAFALAGVVETPVVEPTVVITMPLSGSWVGKHEDIWAFDGGRNSAPPIAAKFLLHCGSLDPRARL